MRPRSIVAIAAVLYGEQPKEPQVEGSNPSGGLSEAKEPGGSETSVSVVSGGLIKLR